MELSTNVLNALKCLNGQQTQKVKLSNEQFNILLKHVFDSFLVRAPSKGSKFDLHLDENQLVESTGLSPAELKDAIASLYTFLSELAKNDLDSISACTFLEDNGFTNERIQVFKQEYESKKNLIRLFLSSCSHSFPHIVDVKWRLDYSIKENALERLNEPIYLVELLVEIPNKNELDSVQFSCTVDQLQDFIYKLKEISKSLEKLAQI